MGGEVVKDEVREIKKEEIVSLDSFRQVKSLLEKYGFQVLTSELKKVARQTKSNPKKMAAMYLNNQIKNTTKGVFGFEQGLMINGDAEKVLSRSKGAENFFCQPKADQIWSVIYINFELARDFNEAILRCKRLMKFFVDKTKFVSDTVLSNRFDRSPFKIIECRRLFDAVPYYLIQNGKFSCLIKKKKRQTMAEVLQEVNCQWRRARVFHIV